MHYFVLAGVLGSGKFTSVLSIAESLEKKYPYIIFHKIFVKHNNWKEWLASVTKKNGWNHFSLPIIWKEIPFRGGKQCLIGGYNCFVEYCSEMYCVDFSFLKEKLKCKGFHTLIKEIHYKENLRMRNALPRQVCIYGAGSVLTHLFLPLLVNISGLATNDGLTIGLYDVDMSNKELLEDIVDEFCNIVPQDACGRDFTAHVINNISSVLKYCDLFILIIPEFLDMTNSESWSQAVSYAAEAGHALAYLAKENIRVILASESINSPICLCAAAFAQAAMPNVLSQNVVAVTASIGIKIRSILANSLQVPLNIVKEVPVWGFEGVSHLLDPSLIVPDDENLHHSELAQKFHTNPVFKSEFLNSYIWPLYGRRKETMEITLGRKPHWATVEALMDTLGKWYSKDSIEKVSFMGIFSDGTFGIPPGIYFSQPSVLAGGIWRPYEAYELPTDKFCKIADLCNTATLLTEIYLNKDKCRYRLTGLNVESDDSYFTNGECERVKFNSSYENTVKIEECEPFMDEQDYNFKEAFVKDIMKEIMHKILTDLRLEIMLPCFFHPEENYDLVVDLMKEIMQKILYERQLEVLIPCLFSPDDNLDFIKALVKESVNRILTNMNFEALITCIIPRDDTDFIAAIMKELMHRSLADQQLQELMPCIFPWTDNEIFVMDLMKELIHKALFDLQSSTLLPCLFPYSYVKNNTENNEQKEDSDE